MEVVSPADKLGRIREYWSPKIVGELNDTYVKVVKFQGEFVWHHHDREDELFLVIDGRLRMQFRDGDRDLTTLNTGNVVNERTRRQLERI